MRMSSSAFSGSWATSSSMACKARRRPSSSEARKASAHYILGLGYLGKGQNEDARIEFEKAVELNVSHIWARVWLTEMK